MTLERAILLSRYRHDVVLTTPCHPVSKYKHSTRTSPEVIDDGHNKDSLADSDGDAVGHRVGHFFHLPVPQEPHPQMVMWLKSLRVCDMDSEPKPRAVAGNSTTLYQGRRHVACQ